MYEESKEHWIKIGIIALVMFLVAYLAFFLALKHNLRKMSNPYYQVQNLEKIMEKQERDLERFNEKNMLN